MHRGPRAKTYVLFHGSDQTKFPLFIFNRLWYMKIAKTNLNVREDFLHRGVQRHLAVDVNIPTTLTHSEAVYVSNASISYSFNP